MSLVLAVLLGVNPPMADDADIVVIARQVEAVQLTLGRYGQGRVVCNLTRSSGNTRVDDAVCRRAARCLPRRRVTAEQTDRCLARARADVVRRWDRAQ